MTSMTDPFPNTPCSLSSNPATDPQHSYRDRVSSNHRAPPENSDTLCWSSLSFCLLPIPNEPPRSVLWLWGEVKGNEWRAGKCEWGGENHSNKETQRTAPPTPQCLTLQPSSVNLEKHWERKAKWVEVWFWNCICTCGKHSVILTLMGAGMQLTLMVLEYNAVNTLTYCAFLLY